MLEHGGGLHQAARHYGIAASAWLDLSTGINPSGWPVPEIPLACWQQLPQADSALEQAAAAYYGVAVDNLLAVAGSQAAIQLLPRLRPTAQVAVLAPAYAEHAHAWQREGHHVKALCSAQIDSQLATTDVLLLVNPNNPTGEQFSPSQLLRWHAQLAVRGGWLVVDEAYLDITPQLSLAAACPKPGLIVLRSVGKFFGLAGARVGFVLAEAALLSRMQALQGPWSVSGPARWVVAQVLRDASWQQTMRLQLRDGGARLQAVLKDAGLLPAGGCGLFQWVKHEEARQLHVALAQRAILTRLFVEPLSLRFGLPASEQDWQRLVAALAATMNTSKD